MKKTPIRFLSIARRLIGRFCLGTVLTAVSAAALSPSAARADHYTRTLTFEAPATTYQTAQTPSIPFSYVSGQSTSPSCSASWFHASVSYEKTSDSTGIATFRVFCDANYSETTRTGTITGMFYGNTYVITVIQCGTGGGEGSGGEGGGEGGGGEGGGEGTGGEGSGGDSGEGAGGELSPVYRFYSPKTKGHFFTMNEGEKDDLIATASHIWNFEGTAYYAYRTQVSGTVPLYRFYSPGAKGHFYTRNEGEKDGLIADHADIWNYEGIAYYVAPSHSSGTTPVYRFWAPGAKHHFYTRSEAEKDNLIATAAHIWNYEGVAFYAWPTATAAQSVQANSASLAPPRLFVGDSGDGPSEVPSLPPDSAAFALVSLPDEIQMPDEGVAEMGGASLEIRIGKPEDGIFASELDDDWEGEAVALRLLLPDGVFSVLQRDEDTGGVVDGEAEGAVDFDLPASGAWYLLRVLDADGEEAYSRWMKAE